jgi:APA family basic amino acid/polyamine antiporter
MQQLLRTLRLHDLALLIVGAVIGSGIFLVPAQILRQVQGSTLLATLVWLAGGVLALLGALTYGELATMKPSAGGIYVYVRDAFGPMPAFLYGWSLFLAISSGAVSALAVAFSTYLGSVIPLGPLSAKMVALGSIAAVMIVNVLGTRKSSDLQNWTTLIKVLLLVGITAVLLYLGRSGPEVSASLWPTGTKGVFSGFGLAMVTALWAYEGWQFVTYSAGEAVNPRRDFPRALFWAVLFLTVLYVVADFGYLVALGPQHAAASDVIASDSLRATLGPWAAKLVSLTILISVFSGMNSVVLTAPRVFYAMGCDGLFFRKLAEVHPRFRTPAIAVIALCLWSAVLSTIGSFQKLIGYTMFVAWIFYGLGGASVFPLRRREPQADRPFRVPGYPWTSALFVASAFALVLNVIVATPWDAAKGLVIVVLGCPVYWFIFRRRPHVHEQELPSPEAPSANTSIPG